MIIFFGLVLKYNRLTFERKHVHKPFKVISHNVERLLYKIELVFHAGHASALRLGIFHVVK